MVRFTVYFAMVGDPSNRICLFDTTSPEKDFKIESPTLELEENAAGTFEFTMTPNHPFFNQMLPRQTLIYVYRNGNWLWEGQVMDTEDNFFNERKVYCEGALAYLNDTIQMPFEYRFTTAQQYIQLLLEAHNRNVESYAPYKIIELGYIKAVDNFPESVVGGYDNTMKYLTDFLDNYGGHLYLLTRDDGTKVLNIYENYLNTSTQTIDFGANLLDYSNKRELPELCTVVIPLGKTIDEEEEEVDTYTTPVAEDKVEKRVTIESVNDGLPYIIADEERLKQFGWIEKIVQYDDIDDPKELYKRGKKYLEGVDINNLTLNVTAVDLAYLAKKGSDLD